MKMVDLTSPHSTALLEKLKSRCIEVLPTFHEVRCCITTLACP